LTGEDAPDPPPAERTDEVHAPVHLERWYGREVLSVAFVAMAAGFGQFGAVAALGDVAKSFGHVVHGLSFADQAGLSGTMLGIGLAIIRLTSLGGLPLSGLADRLGRRPTMLAACAGGLSLTVLAAASPSYWWFVAIFALGRPLLTATLSITQVCEAELTASSDRAKAIALGAAGYGVGAGIVAVIHGLAASALGFRGVFLLAAVPLALLPVLRRHVPEPDRFLALVPSEHGRPVLGPVGGRHRRRLVVVATLAFAVSVITGPANSLVFIYAQNVHHVSGVLTSAMVVSAGLTGFVGLVAGRWAADVIGRRPTIAVAMAAMAACGVLTYSGSTVGLLLGYVAGVTASAMLAPAAGSLANELFPTSVRASAAGWYSGTGVLGAVTGLVVFGAVADAGSAGNHALLAAMVTFLPVVPVAGLLALLPEPRGREPEEMGPTASP
jgi:MFS family permease